MFAINSKDEPLFSPDWESRLALVNVVQTRFIGSGDREFFKKLIDNKEFIILHVVCSGWGGTKFEPGIPDTEATHKGVKMIADMGFPVNQMVLSLSPLFVNNNGLKRAISTLDQFRDTGISRVRYSRFSLTRKSRERFLDRFNAIPKNNEMDLDAYFRSYGYYRFSNDLLSQTDLATLGYSDLYDKEQSPVVELITRDTNCKGGCLYCEKCNSNHKYQYSRFVQ